MTDLWLERFEQRRQKRAQAKHQFPLLGEHLTCRAHVAPETALRFYDLQARFNAYGEQVRAAEAAGKELPTESGIPEDEMFEVSEATILACLDEESHAAWQRLRSPDLPDPLDIWDLYGIATYVLARASGLPTVAPTGSSNGRTNTKPSSPAGSRSRARTKKA